MREAGVQSGRVALVLAKVDLTIGDCSSPTVRTGKERTTFMEAARVEMSASEDHGDDAEAHTEQDQHRTQHQPRRGDTPAPLLDEDRGDARYATGATMKATQSSRSNRRRASIIATHLFLGSRRA